ncbi:TMEDA protein, partial [Polyodon spathula]|nr:TMEDA protein [Polyodon spathula]
MGQYEVSEVQDVVTNLKVTDSAEHTLYKKDEAQKGRFAFSTENFDEFDICFESVVPAGFKGVTEQLVVLNIKHGTEAKNYEKIGKAEKLKPLEVKLRQMEDLSESIVKELVYMKRNAEHRSDTNESTGSRVFGFSLLSMLCLVSLAVWQVLYLRRFFKSKRLIE